MVFELSIVGIIIDYNSLVVGHNDGLVSESELPDGEEKIVMIKNGFEFKI